jgi:hypothetical protein
MPSYDTIRTTLASAVANGGTFTVGYPNNRDPGAYTGGYEHEVQTVTYGALTIRNGKAAFSFGASSVTITNNSGETLDAGTPIVVQFDRVGENDLRQNDGLANENSMTKTTMVVVNLGAPDAASATAVCASQAGTAATAMTINGALAVNGAVIFDVPRNVVAAWTNAAVLTVEGFDEYGVFMRESSASGTTFAGRKAFKRVTRVTPSANITGATVGNGDVIGLPMFLSMVGSVVRELQDGAAATAGTLVAGVTTRATALTGDVRGTYDPSAACNGALSFQLLIAAADASYRGIAQF